MTLVDRLTPDGAAEAAVSTVAAVPRPRLVVVPEGHESEACSVLLDRECQVGSAEECDLVLGDPSVAPRHALLVPHGEALWIEDLGGASGTRVDGLALEAPYRLHHGQEIGIGSVLLRFEDPAQALLEEMGLLTVVERPQEPCPGDRSNPAVWRRCRLGLAVVVLVVLVAWLAHGALSSSPAAWRVVQVPSAEVVAGEWIDVRSPDVERGASYQVTLGGTPVERLVAQQGKLGIEIPAVSDLAGGSHSLPLRISQGEVAVAMVSVDYRVVPRLLAIGAAEQEVAGRTVRVGETLRIEGLGLSHPSQRTLVGIGETGVTPTQLGPSVLEVRVPVVTRHQTVRLPLVVWVGEERLSWNEPLSVAPRQPEVLALQMRTHFVPALDAWEISAPFGSMLYLHREAAGGEVPAEVTVAARQLERAFERAVTDDGIGFEMAPSDTGYRLTFGAGEVVALVSADELATAGMVGGRVIEPELQAAWLAQSWNHLLNTFARGEAPPEESRGTPLLRTLARLVEHNFERGGLGRPEATDLAALDPAQREALEFAPLQPPGTYGDLGGLWQARLENVFFGREQVEVTLELRLVARGERLGGTARLSFEDSVLTHGPPEAEVRGRLSAEAPPRITLEIDFEGTPGRLELEGSVVEQGLVGQFQATGRPRMGAWIAHKTREDDTRRGNQKRRAP